MSEQITVPRPTVPFGPKGVPVDIADARSLREAAGNIEFSRCMGSNLTATVTKLLRDTADAIERGHRADEGAAVGLDPAYRDVELCSCSTPGWKHHTGFHDFVRYREERAVSEARARIEAVADEWAAIPPYLASDYDRGRVDQRQMCETELRGALDAR